MKVSKAKQALSPFFSLAERQTVEVIFHLLPKRSQLRLIQATLASFIVSFLDLLGVGLVGILGSLSVNSISGRAPGDQVSRFLRFIQIENFSFIYQAFILAFCTLFLLLVRTAISVILNRRTLHYLSRQGAQVSANLFSRFMNSDLSVRNNRSSQETIFALTTGITTSVLNVVGSLVTIIADVWIAVLLFLTLCTLNVLTGVLSLFLFGSLSLFLFIKIRTKINDLARKEIELSVQSNSSILGAMSLFHDIHVRNLQEQFSNRILGDRLRLARISAEKLFIPSISKYVIESALLVGTVVLCAARFFTQDAPHAVANISVFLVAGSRIAPALLRIQQSSIVVKSSLAGLQPLTNLIQDLDDFVPCMKCVNSTLKKDFSPEIIIEKMSYKFPDQESETLVDISYSRTGFGSLAIVGGSGSGKTTLVDLVLGLRSPQSGTVTISGVDPNSAISNWPGKIGYVPQESSIMSGTIIQNITLDFSNEEFDADNMKFCLEIANLNEWVTSLPDGLRSFISENGVNLSGGQRQRIGIARALYTRPKLLILDESTSSLDAISESEIIDAVLKMSKEMLVIVIAHRLSSIRKVDEIIYLSDGKVEAKGSFDELRAIHPMFEEQVKRMGL